jgi:uncharacterized protein (DUF433 family)
MSSVSFRLIGGGVYSLREAERLTGIPRRRIRRWTEGYQFVSTGRMRQSQPIIASTLRDSVDQPALSFADLIEIRFLYAFLQHGVSWPAIRIAAIRAREFLGRHHPFSTRLFKTDGHTILAEIVRPGDDPKLLDLVRNQWELNDIVTPMLYAGIEFNDLDEPYRWWPMGKKRGVVLDPARAFGAPVVADGGVPTQVLARAVAIEGSQKFVAQIYDVSRLAVRQAVAFEAHYSA